MDAEFGPSMIYVTNLDKPGFIGKFSSTLGDAGINIATFHVGREAPGGDAIALIEIDGELSARRARQGAGAAAGAAGQAAAVLSGSASAPRVGADFLGRDRDAGEHQRVADGVVELETLAEQHDRQHRAEHRHEVMNGAARLAPISSMPRLRKR